VIDATAVSQASGMGRRTNTVLQTCFFALSGVLPKDEAIEQIKKAITEDLRQEGRADREDEFRRRGRGPRRRCTRSRLPAEPAAEAVAPMPPSFTHAPDFVPEGHGT